MGLLHEFEFPDELSAGAVKLLEDYGLEDHVVFEIVGFFRDSEDCILLHAIDTDVLIRVKPTDLDQATRTINL